jgi:hypothetical protein
MELLSRCSMQGIAPLLILYVYGGPIHAAYLFYVLGVILFTTITSWIVGIRMRRRIKSDLGRKVHDGDLSSIDTWMKVDEVEEKKHPGKEWAPESSASDYESTKGDL